MLQLSSQPLLQLLSKLLSKLWSKLLSKLWSKLFWQMFQWLSWERALRAKAGRVGVRARRLSRAGRACVLAMG